MNKNLVKEVFIIALLVLVVVFTIAILFYDFIPFKEEVSQVKYNPDAEVLQAIEEIQGTSNFSNTSQDSLLKSYSIDKDDLTMYANQKSYESGKQDPFAEYSQPIEQTVKTEKTEGIKNNSQNSNPIVTPNTQDEKNKIDTNTENEIKNEIKSEEVKQEEKNTSTTGTFFEKKNSK